MTANIHEGGCLCGAIRFETTADPVRVTICHCQFCQRATGAAYMIEPVFHLDNLRLTHGVPATWDHVSGGSKKVVRIHFCRACASKLWLTFERFAGFAGLYAGAFDDPNWFKIGPDNSKQIFIRHARPDSILMPHIDAFMDHAMTNDGAPLTAVVHDHPHLVGR